MAVTVEKVLDIKGQTRELRLPVASGETIYQGTMACIDDDGYLRNLSSTYAPQAKLVVYVADGSANSTGPAATTSAGSISGSLEQGSDDAGDKTTRLCYADGMIKVTLTSSAQSQLGKTVYATDNFTVDETQNGGVKIGTLCTYISATSGWVDLNKFYQHDGTIFWKQAITASSGNAGMFSIANPTGATAVIERLALDITTASTVAGAVNVGVTTASASADTLIDGGTSSVTGVFDNITDAGTNGGATVKWTSTQYITGTCASALATTSFVGSVGVWYRAWE